MFGQGKEQGHEEYLTYQQEPPENPKSKILKVIGIIFIIFLILAIILAVFLFLKNKTTADNEPPKEEPQENLEPLVDNEEDEPQESDYDMESELFKAVVIDETLIDYLLEYKEDLNSLAVGFTTLAAFLETPDKIKEEEISNIQQDMSAVEYQYEEIISSLAISDTDESNFSDSTKEIVQILSEDYQRLFEYRVEQVKGLTFTEGATGVNYETTTAEEVTSLWQETVKRHRDYYLITGVDYTGGLADLMQ